jgi:hypothetical protein
MPVFAALKGAVSDRRWTGMPWQVYTVPPYPLRRPHYAVAQTQLAPCAVFALYGSTVRECGWM